MKTQAALLLRASVMLSCLLTTLRAQVPQLINYQGRVAVGAMNFDGAGQFNFALVSGTTHNASQRATATGQDPNGSVIAVDVTFGGSGYTSPPRVQISGFDGSGATATATVVNGHVTAITVTNGGSGYDGVAVLIDPPPPNLAPDSFWSNDGTSSAGSQPAAAVTLTVTKGLYSVLLGDATLPNMTSVPASVFANADVRLRVWFNDGTHGSQLLAPDQRIAAVGYAMMAGSVPDGAITAGKLAANSVQNANIANGAVGNNQLAPSITLSGTITAQSFIGNGSGLTNVPVGGNTVNPLRVAQLKWYLGHDEYVIGSGSSPTALVFDGVNIWAGGNTAIVSKLRATDSPFALSYGSFSAGGTNSNALAFDGTYIWVVSRANNRVKKLLASDGQVPFGDPTLLTPSNPTAVAFDGVNIWVTTHALMSGQLTKFRAGDGAYANGNLNNSSLAVGTNPTAVAFDGTNIWTANYDSNTVTKIHASDLAYANGTLANSSFTVGANPTALAFDGTNVWVVNYGSNTVTKLRASDGSYANGTLANSSFTVGANPSGVAFDGANIWVANYTSNTVTELRASDGSYVNGTLDNSSVATGNNPTGVGFDGTNIWVANTGSGSLSRF